MKNNSSLHYGNYNKWGGTVRINLLVRYVSYPIVSIKHLHLKGLSKDFLLKFEAVEDIIYNISAGWRQYPDYLQTVYNYMQKLLKTSIIM